MFTLNSNIRKFVSLLVGVALTLTMVSNTESAKANFAPPIMATIFPSSGTVTDGDLITITGQNLQRVNDIEVGGARVFRGDLEKSPIGEWITFRAPYSSKTGPSGLVQAFKRLTIAQLWPFVATLRRLWKGVDTSLGTVQHGKL